LIGGRQSIESDLTIARSLAVAVDAANRLRQEGVLPARAGNEEGPERSVSALRHKADIEVIRGGILQVSVVDHRPAFAKALVTAYVLAIRNRLEALNVEESKQKKAIAADRLADATLNLARAQSELDRFRLANRLAEPQIELGAAISLVSGLEARLAAQQAELATLEKFATNDNIEVQTARAEVEAIKGQLAAAEASASSGPGTSVGQMRPKISEYENLFRNEKYAEAEFEIFKRYLDTVTVEQMSAGVSMNVVEPPYLDPDRQFNEHALAALILLIIVAVFAEFYIQRPPIGAAVREAL
jgi:capsule polysaccharide export protein KpsE/RkpR